MLYETTASYLGGRLIYKNQLMEKPNVNPITGNTFLLQVQYGAYVTLGGLGSVLKLMFMGMLFLLLVKFNFGRKLLTKVSFQNTKCFSVWRYLPPPPSNLLLVFLCNFLLFFSLLYSYSTRNFSLVDTSQRKDQPRSR